MPISLSNILIRASLRSQYVDTSTIRHNKEGFLLIFFRKTFSYVFDGMATRAVVNLEAHSGDCITKAIDKTNPA